MYTVLYCNVISPATRCDCLKQHFF